jgi:hypothetical protein
VEKQDESFGTPTRRGFLLGLAAAAAVPTLSASGQASTPAGSVNQEPATTASPEVDALMAIVMLKYGAYLKKEELPLVRRSLERQNTAIATLMKVPIHNDDAPDFLFSPDSR